MGASPQSLLDHDYKDGMVLDNKGKCKSLNGSLWSKVLEAQAMRRRQGRKQSIKINRGGHGWSNTHGRILMKRRALLRGSRRPINGIENRVRTLKKLVPNGRSMGLDGLFRETADYIMCLQMQVKVMQIMVKLLSGSDD